MDKRRTTPLENVRLSSSPDVQMIRLKSKPEQWRHVAGVDNPADLCSRRCTAEALIAAQLWWHGPAWLQQDQDIWPGEREDLYNDSDNKDLLRESKCLLISNENPSVPDLNLNRFSSWSRASRAMAYVKIWAVKKPIRPVGDLTAIEIKAAKMEIIRAVQKECSPFEFNILQEKEKRLPERSRLHGLRPYFDPVDRIIRLHRRTEFSEEEADNLILLPYKHRLNNLIVWDTHKKLQHAGVSQTITEIRQ